MAIVNANFAISNNTQFNDDIDYIGIKQTSV